MVGKVRETRTFFDPQQKIWSGPKEDIESGSDVSLGRSVLEGLQKNPEHISQICDNNGRHYTNEDIATMSIRVAQHLQEKGIQQEDIIGICASNSDFLAPLTFGALLCGTTLSTLDPSFDKDGIRHIFSITKPRLMFCDGKVYDTVKAALTEINLNIPIYTMKDHLEGVKQIQELIASTGKEKSGPKEDIESGSDVSLGRSVLEGLQKNPEHISQICDNNGRHYTNEDIATMSIRVAQHLQEKGIQQEDIIGICASNSDFLAPLTFGALLCGTTLSTLDPSFDKDGIRHIFSITKPRLMFCDGKVYDTVKAALTEINLNIPIYTMKDHLEGVKQIQELIASTGKEKSFKVTPLKLGSSQTAAIVCSSGTTGLPKGVCMSHESLLSSRIYDLSPEDKLVYFSTIYWASGLLCLLHGTISGCTRVITDQLYSPELFLRMVEENKINVVLSPPSQMAMAIQSPNFKQRDLSSLELYLCGGSAVPFAVVQAFANHLKDCTVIVGYGMSEISGACCFGKPNKPGGNGQLMANFEVQILNETGKRVGISECGEICLRSPFKWAGYYNNKEATNAIYDHDEWIHSGDIGFFEDEELFIVDRKKDILKYNNFHFFPTEIEEVIIQIEDVVEVCVCGIPDIVSSFLPAAAVVKVPNSKLTEDYIINYVAERMAHFKHLRGGVYFMDTLPKTASGKNIRAKVTKIVEALWSQSKACNGSIKKHSNVTVSV